MSLSGFARASSSTVRVLAASGAAWLAVAACSSAATTTAPDLGPDAVLFRSPHFRLHARANDNSVCASTTDELERHFAALSAFFALDWPAGLAVDYYKLRTIGEVKATRICSADSEGCAPGTSVITADPVNRHELTHAYLATLGHPPLVLMEGAAKGLSCDSGPLTVAAEAALRKLSAADLVQWPARDAPDLRERYVAAAWLVRDLIDRHGMARFRMLYARAPDSQDPGRLDSAFQSIYGIGLEQAWSEARAAQRPGGACLRVDACPSAAPAEMPAPWRVNERCGVPDEEQDFLVSGATPTRVTLRGGGGARLYSCDGATSTPQRWVGGFIGAGGGTMLAALRPGRYYVRHSGTPVVSVATMTVGPTAVVLASAACDAAAPALAVDPSPSEFQLAVPADGATWWTRLTLARGARVSRADSAVDVRLCPGCAPDDSACLTLPAEPDTVLVSPGTHVVHVRTETAPARFAVVAFMSEQGP